MQIIQGQLWILLCSIHYIQIRVLNLRKLYFMYLPTIIILYYTTYIHRHHHHHHQIKLRYILYLPM